MLTYIVSSSRPSKSTLAMAQPLALHKHVLEKIEFFELGIQKQHGGKFCCFIIALAGLARAGGRRG